MVLTRAGEIAAVIDGEVGSGASARAAFVDSAFERILGRMPDRGRARRVPARVSRGWSRRSRRRRKQNQIAAPEARARAALVHVLLNHNDFVTIR